MKLLNRTPFPAVFLTGSTGEQEIVGILAAKVTFRLRNGSLEPVAGEEAWPVFEKPFAFRGVSLGPETDFRKEGVDILILGEAKAPGGRPVPWLRVGVECGALKHEAVVFGDRVWLREAFRFVASEPVPFKSMPITNDRAFGGKARLGDAEVQHPVNPEGTGFLYMEDDVEGTPLPNVEDEKALIGQWQDKPRPACFFKPLGFLEPRGAPPPSPDEVPRVMMRTAFNQTVPELVATPGTMGKTLRLFGFSAQGDVLFPVPDLSGPRVHVRLGDHRSRFPSTLSTVAILVEERVLVATYLSLFRYLMRPMEERSVELRWSDGPGVESWPEAAGEGSHG